MTDAATLRPSTLLSAAELPARGCMYALVTLANHYCAEANISRHCIRSYLWCERQFDCRAPLHARPVPAVHATHVHNPRLGLTDLITTLEGSLCNQHAQLTACCCTDETTASLLIGCCTAQRTCAIVAKPWCYLSCCSTLLLSAVLL